MTTVQELPADDGVNAAASYVARRIVTLAGPPLDGGCIVVQGGKIAAVGPRRIATGRVVDLGDALIAPGFVNAHTHLEFSGLTKPLGTAGMNFASWLREVIAFRREGPFDPQPAVVAGLQESLAAGVTTVGEITSTVPRQLFERPPRGPNVTAFIELIGLSESRAAAKLASLDEFLAAGDAAGVHRGISPHAPYTVRPSLVDSAVVRSTDQGVPLAFHLAESPEELELLRDGTGPLVDLLREIGAWDAAAIPRGSCPLDYLKTLSSAPRTLLIHGNYLADDEIYFLAAQAERMATVYCPRTHAYFGHPRHPLEKLLAAGAAVAVGTDGRCTSPDLDLRAELRYLRRAFPNLSPERIVRLGTLDGARALGVERDVGTLEVGKQADFVVVAEVPDESDPYAALLDERAVLLRTVVAGRLRIEFIR